MPEDGPDAGSGADADDRDESGTSLDDRRQREAVRERYARIATDSTRDDVTDEGNRSRAGDGRGDDCCGDGCRGDGSDSAHDETARKLGYSADEVGSVPDGANLGLGCGNPAAIAALEPGETVLDLGSGAGFDCFLAAQEVGTSGRVVGVDMTPEMVENARENARQNGATNVAFRLGEIEHLPVADGTVDVVVSNCVINLSPDKPQVFREAHRVLRPGGRLAVSDVVLTAELPADLRADPESVAACVAGASTVDRLRRMLADAGFERIAIEPKDDSDSFIREWDDDRDLSEFLVSAAITGRKPPSSGTGAE